MKRTIAPFFFCLAAILGANAQTNMVSINPVAEQIMLGNYDPAAYTPSVVINQPDDLVTAIMAGISPDSLKSYLLKLSTFENRNTGADTVSDVTGMGAARRWVHQRFTQISAENGGRLVPSYLQFDIDICGMGQHRNIFAVLPGIDTTANGVILIEAHIDSRCAVLCDIDCQAHGMEDNGSGTALVIELARVMSQLSFDRTVVFMATIGEEQGLVGADAFAKYAKSIGIPLVAVLNNDVIGGIVCGQTSSPPSCPGFNQIDSTQVRLFSQGSFNSRNKQLARFIKLQYMEEVQAQATVPMMVTIMTAEDRTGRGGDHIPFRQQGFAAMRFTSANEHGNADVTNANYHDRQHTSDDVLGVDTDGDLVLDSFFVDFNYLARNTAINGVAAAMAGIGPEPVDLTASKSSDSVYVEIIDPNSYGEYRVFVRSTANDFDSLFATSQPHFVFARPSGTFFVSAASVDGAGIESLFSKEVNPPLVNATDEVEVEEIPAIELLQNRPNPFDEATTISFLVNREVAYKTAKLVVSDLQGKALWQQNIRLQMGMNEVLYEHGYNVTGVYAYSLVVDGKVVGMKEMVFAN
ncbi:MAG: M28 family peptidase [Saprospiraceae bacterium]|nr:M28 family peptidase [Saprospiraceae bacterium]MCF8251662.1 M28 family peptidase [Saprospiraceae bacterium]MCF8281072.1 M28 family peptidase [Bacteroidales bacterium]MCF8313281.1 M28 family peptidase [Saprospiraceae bacterium]MCF8442025.1 M28 family peptidase [Saprospiraceae bacterium]